MSNKNDDKTLQKLKMSETVSALLVSNGNITEAAKSLGIHRTTVYERIKKDPEITKIVSEISAGASNMLSIASLRAVEKLIELMEKPETSLKACLEILNRAGLTEKEGVVEQGQPIGILWNVTRQNKEEKDS